MVGVGVGDGTGVGVANTSPRSTGVRVQEFTRGQGASVLVDVAPAGAESMMECVRSLEPGGRVALLGSNPELFSLPIRYLMIRSIEFTSVTGRHYSDIPELLEMARGGVIDTRHVTTRIFPLEAVNEALDYIETRQDDEPLWPMYAPSS